MRELSLPVNSTNLLNKATESNGKNSANFDKLANAESSSTFQMALSKQVQAQQEPVPQVNTNSVNENINEKVKSKSDNVQNKTIVSNDKKVEVKKSEQKNIKQDMDNENIPEPISNESNGHASKKLLDLNKKSDGKSEDVESKTTDTNMPAVLTPTLPALTTALTLLPQKITPVLKSNAQSTPRLDGVAGILETQDNPLANLSSQVKNDSALEVVAQEKLVTVGDKLSSDQAKWLDILMPNGAKLGKDNETTTSKSLLNAIKDSVTKESTLKDNVMPAIYQPVSLLNALSSVQVAGSTNNINAYPGKAGWDQAISQKVVWMVGTGEQSATLTLNPPDLGPLQVVIHVHNDQADATFISNNAEVRQALQDGMSNLSEKMRDSGIQLGQANISSGDQSRRNLNQNLENISKNQLSNNDQINTFIPNRTILESNGLIDTFA